MLGFVLFLLCILCITVLCIGKALHDGSAAGFPLTCVIGSIFNCCFFSAMNCAHTSISMYQNNENERMQWNDHQIYHRSETYSQMQAH